MIRTFADTSLAVAALTVFVLGIAWLPATSPAKAQSECLSQSECDALKEEIRGLRRELKPTRRESRDLRRQIKMLPEGDPQRAVLREQIKALKQEAKPIRQELRPLKQARREGCRNCQ